MALLDPDGGSGSIPHGAHEPAPGTLPHTVHADVAHQLWAGRPLLLSATSNRWRSTVTQAPSCFRKEGPGQHPVIPGQVQLPCQAGCAARSLQAGPLRLPSQAKR